MINLLNNNNIKLDPNFVTGLTEAEGSFSILKSKNIKAKFKYNFSLRFKLTMLKNEIELINYIKSYFGCGLIYQNKDDTVDFIVYDINSINNIIIPHFMKYPLRGIKYLDFLSFKKVANMIILKEHLTEKGIEELISISNSMNRFRKFVEEYSPLHTIKNNPEYIPFSAHYINGFIAGDGCLALVLKGKNFGRISLQISQHINNRLLLVSILEYFGYSLKVYPHSLNSVQITLGGIKL